MSDITLYHRIRNGEIGFYNKDKKLDSQIDDVGEYGWKLIEHIIKQSDNYLTIKGSGLDSYIINGLEIFLWEKENLFALTDFMIQMLSKNHDAKFHVEAGLEKINAGYPQERESFLYNGLGHKTANVKDWLPNGTVFERDWNLFLCSAIGGLVGYPGYEWPRTEKTFEAVCAEHAGDFLIGTKSQLSRYEDYAKKFPKYADSIRENLRNFM